MRTNQIPTEEDWGDYKSDLDQADAHRTFFGKTLEEVIPDFERYVIGRAEDLHFMPAVPFRFYMFAFRNYLLSQNRFKHNYDAPDAASCFLGLVIAKLKETPNDIAPIMDDLLPAIEYVASNQKLYDADEEIYGSFPDKLHQIRALYKHV